MTSHPSSQFDLDQTRMIGGVTPPDQDELELHPDHTLIKRIIDAVGWLIDENADMRLIDRILLVFGPKLRHLFPLRDVQVVVDLALDAQLRQGEPREHYASVRVERHPLLPVGSSSLLLSFDYRHSPDRWVTLQSEADRVIVDKLVRLIEEWGQQHSAPPPIAPAETPLVPLPAPVSLPLASSTNTPSPTVSPSLPPAGDYVDNTTAGINSTLILAILNEVIGNLVEVAHVHADEAWQRLISLYRSLPDIPPGADETQRKELQKQRHDRVEMSDNGVRQAIRWWLEETDAAGWDEHVVLRTQERAEAVTSLMYPHLPRHLYRVIRENELVLETLELLHTLFSARLSAFVTSPAGATVMPTIVTEVAPASPVNPPTPQDEREWIR